MNTTLRLSLRTALRLAAFTVGSAAVLAGLHWATRDTIQVEQQKAERAALTALLPASGYDNDPVTDAILVTAPEGLGDSRPRLIRRARIRGEPVAAVLSVIAPDGYAGAIELLVGVQVDGRVIGVRVLSHQETPGLGDPIDKARSDWVDGFVGRSLGDPPAERWKVRRDGGEFDQFAGATITPRAVVAAVRRALAWFAAHQSAVFAEAKPPLKPQSLAGPLP